MILVGKKIIEEQKMGQIKIEPFVVEQVNPNSYNYRLGRYLKMSYEFEQGVGFKIIDLKEHTGGFVIEPGNLYLGSTYESIGSSAYAMSLIGRSSIGRLGMFLQVSANLGHTGSSHNWTLEIYPTMKLKLYYKMIVGQVSFWTNYGDEYFTQHRYNKFSEAMESLGVDI